MIYTVKQIAEKELFAFIERSRSEPKHRLAARLRGSDFLDNLDKRQQDSNHDDNRT